MGLPNLAVKRPVTITMVTLIAVILGIISFTNIQQEFMPEIDLGIAIVIANFDGAGPEEVENLVTRPLEMALGTVSSLQNINTTSSTGSSLIMLEFEAGTDMNHAALNMRENIDLFSALLPDGVNPQVFQIDPSMMASFTVGISGPYDITRLRYRVDNEIMPQLERLDGVASVSLTGGMDREITIELFPDMLINYGITANQVAGIIASENINLPGGTLRQGDTYLQVRTVGEFTSIHDIENLPIRTPNGATIRLSNLARVTDGYADVSSYVLINGSPGVSLTIMEQSTANTVTVGQAIHRELADLRMAFPHLEILLITDNSQFVVDATNAVWTTVFQAAGLAMVVLFIFLGNVRAPLIIGMSIPISLITALAMMYFTGMTLNLISLNAMVITVGMLIDNAIVVLDNISRYIERGFEPKEAARKGASEVGLSVTASTLTTIVVFLPVIFVDGIAGAMFGSLGLVITYTLVASLVVSMSFIPMVGSKFLKQQKDQPVVKKATLFSKVWDKWQGAYERFEDGYVAILKWSLHHRAVIVLLFFLIVGGGIPLLGNMGMEFMAPMDQGEVIVTINTPQGTVLEEISDLTQLAISRIEDMPEIDTLAVTVGAADGFAALFGGGGSSSTAILNIGLVDRNQRGSIDDIMEELRQRIHPLVGGEFTVSIGGMSGDMDEGNSVTLTIRGDNMALLSQTGDDIVEMISTIPYIRNAENSLTAGNPTAQVVIDRQRASFYGIQAFDIANTINMAISGNTITQFRVDGSEVDVVMLYERDRLAFIPDLENLMLASPFGMSVPLAEVARIEVVQGVSAITKQNGTEFISVTADFVGTDLGSITTAISALLANYDFAPGVSYGFGGDFEMMMDSFVDLALAMVLGFLLLYMVIASQFESLAYPSTILFAIPVAWVAGLLGLFILGQNISVVAFVGLIMLMGIVINNGIIFVDYISLKRKEGVQSYEAILMAGKSRMRPILMTTITTVVGVMPMVLSTAEGAEMQQPIGVVVAFGLSFSTVITLVLIPVLYSLLHQVRKKMFA